MPRPMSSSLATRPLRDAMAAVVIHLARSDQWHWAEVLEALSARLEAEPAAAARAVLALFEGPGAWNRVVTDGDWALDTIALSTNSVSYYRERSVTWEEVRAYPRERHAMYRAALDLWLANEPRPVPLPRGEAGPVKLTDYGWGCQIWVRDGGFFARYDRGGHASRWREDAISEDEARHGLLGVKHFSYLLFRLEKRLKAAGLDPYAGSYEPLPEP